MYKIRPPEDSRAVLYFSLELFCHQASNLQTADWSRQKYIIGWALSLAQKNDSEISSSPPHFTGAQNVRNLVSIFDPSRP